MGISPTPNGSGWSTCFLLALYQGVHYFDDEISGAKKGICALRGRSTGEAVAELRGCSGTQFDPDIVDALLRSLGLPGDSHPPHGPDKPVIS